MLKAKELREKFSKNYKKNIQQSINWIEESMLRAAEGGETSTTWSQGSKVDNKIIDHFIGLGYRVNAGYQPFSNFYFITISWEE